MAGEESNNPCCVAKQFGNWCADVDIHVEHEGETYCIFHAPKECPEKLEKWKDNNLVYNWINRAKRNGEQCIFWGSVFPISISFSEFNDERNALPNINFAGAFFADRVNFSGTYFSDAAYFSSVIFSNKAKFTYSTFTNRAHFDNATFDGIAYFDEILMVAGYFHHAKFKNTVLIHPRERFPIYVDFSLTEFEQSVILRELVFAGGYLESCVVDKSIIFDKCDLSSLSLAGAPIENFRFISCTWAQSKGRRIVFDSCARKCGRADVPTQKLGHFPSDKPHEHIDLNIPPDDSILEDLFRRLKAIAQKEHDDLAASDWHYGEKEMQLRRLREESSFKNFRWDWGWFGSNFLYIVTWIYKRISGYGEEPLRAFAVFMVLAILPTPLLSYVWPSLPSPFPGGVEHYLPLMKKIPDGNAWWLSFWMVLWQLLVTIQAALLGFALRNKLRR